LYLRRDDVLSKDGDDVGRRDMGKFNMLCTSGYPPKLYKTCQVLWEIKTLKYVIKFDYRP